MGKIMVSPWFSMDKSYGFCPMACQASAGQPHPWERLAPQEPVLIKKNGDIIMEHPHYIPIVMLYIRIIWKYHIISCNIPIHKLTVPIHLIKMSMCGLPNCAKTLVLEVKISILERWREIDLVPACTSLTFPEYLHYVIWYCVCNTYIISCVISSTIGRILLLIHQPVGEISSDILGPSWAHVARARGIGKSTEQFSQRIVIGFLTFSTDSVCRLPLGQWSWHAMFKGINIHLPAMKHMIPGRWI